MADDDGEDKSSSLSDTPETAWDETCFANLSTIAEPKSWKPVDLCFPMVSLFKGEPVHVNFDLGNQIKNANYNTRVDLLKKNAVYFLDSLPVCGKKNNKEITDTKKHVITPYLKNCCSGLWEYSRS